MVGVILDSRHTNTCTLSNPSLCTPSNPSLCTPSNPSLYNPSNLAQRTILLPKAPYCMQTMLILFPPFLDIFFPAIFPEHKHHTVQYCESKDRIIMSITRKNNSNIPNGDVAKGETIASYVQPFPAKGLGYQRVVFTLYKQNAKVDFSSFKLADGENGKERLFSTRNFYKQFQDEITPAGLSFFQSSWDKSLTKFYHN
uniref:Uncharacterized protein n=1 Tax=Megaselia scalaris TaxID=36166 RepID=T1GAU4_MEGSC